MLKPARKIKAINDTTSPADLEPANIKRNNATTSAIDLKLARKMENMNGTTSATDLEPARKMKYIKSPHQWWILDMLGS